MSTIQVETYTGGDMAAEYISDLHTHTIASGHGTSCTVNDMAREASRKGLRLLGISDHGPATLSAGTPSYFRSLARSPRQRFGISLLFGAECSILDREGRLDLEDGVLAQMDYVIISLHRQVFPPRSLEENTEAVLQAMCHPRVRILGHMDDAHYLLDYPRILRKARDAGVFPEMNEASLDPAGYRGDTAGNCRRILACCRELGLPVLLSSDSHGPAGIGRFSRSSALLRSEVFPESLILNNRLPLRPDPFANLRLSRSDGIYG